MAVDHGFLRIIARVFGGKAIFHVGCTCIKLSLTLRKGRGRPCQSISWAVAGHYLSGLETSSTI